MRQMPEYVKTTCHEHDTATISPRAVLAMTRWGEVGKLAVASPVTESRVQYLGQVGITLQTFQPSARITNS